ncbi:hypothetical protein [Natrinema sp. SYSU A 869]|uniref:hypothetical protein n=1 Tax=Natrinema sp. SYSU A 869 TaxID=2871694 RepID=UPI001CA38741|nr:hypothetical protein [Natrinema sp. SYSU A 869]
MKDALAPDTEYKLIRSETPVDVYGFKLGEPTGEIEWEECGRSHLNIDEIPHTEDCPQRWACTDYWRERFLSK